MEPCMLLILCEGITEKLYFDSVVLHKRIHMVPVKVFGKKGQHRALIDRCVDERKKQAKQFELDENEIETWAVCDCDKMKISYTELLRYSEERKINLAFSNPQFETYLIQHFEFKKTRNKKSALILELEKYIGEKYDKSDLSWFDDMIDKNPAVLNTAIFNSKKLKSRTKIPFLTVQKLTERLLSLAK